MAVIDKPIAEQHRAFARGLNYIEVSPEHPNTGRTHFHGAAVAGILSGQYGVAPESGLYYFAVPDDTEPYARYAEAMEKILELQDSLPGARKFVWLPLPTGWTRQMWQQMQVGQRTGPKQ